VVSSPLCSFSVPLGGFLFSPDKRLYEVAHTANSGVSFLTTRPLVLFDDTWANGRTTSDHWLTV
jgi:hypothetical protein